MATTNDARHPGLYAARLSQWGQAVPALLLDGEHLWQATFVAGFAREGDFLPSDRNTPHRIVNPYGYTVRHGYLVVRRSPDSAHSTSDREDDAAELLALTVPDALTLRTVQSLYRSLNETDYQLDIVGDGDLLGPWATTGRELVHAEEEQNRERAAARARRETLSGRLNSIAVRVAGDREIDYADETRMPTAIAEWLVDRATLAARLNSGREIECADEARTPMADECKTPSGPTVDYELDHGMVDRLTERLQDPVLLARGVPVALATGNYGLAVPVGGRRQAGFCVADPVAGAPAIATMLDLPEEFPNLRWDRDRHTLAWGVDLVGETEGLTGDDSLRAAARLFGYSDHGIEQFVQANQEEAA